MSFVSSTNTLTLGNSTNTTINIGTTATNPTINIGVTGDDNPVFIRGLDPLITSNMASFAQYVLYPNQSGTPSTCCYLLPLSTTQDLMIQWGHFPDVPSAALSTVFFAPFNFRSPPYSSPPYAFVTNFTGGSGSSARINSVTTDNMVVDSGVGNSDKSSFFWLAIGPSPKSI